MKFGKCRQRSPWIEGDLGSASSYRLPIFAEEFRSCKVYALVVRSISMLQRSVLTSYFIPIYNLIEVRCAECTRYYVDVTVFVEVHHYPKPSYRNKRSNQG